MFEIHRQADWVRLVTAHPRPAEPHPGWELPGVNQHVSEIAPLLASAKLRAARVSVRRHVVPDCDVATLIASDSTVTVTGC